MPKFQHSEYFYEQQETVVFFTQKEDKIRTGDLI